MLSKLRLLIFCPAVGSPNGTAPSQRTLEFARSLNRNNITVWITSPYLTRQRRDNENLCLLPMPKDPLRLVKKLKNLVIKNKIDLILERPEGGNVISSGYGIFIGKLLRVPTICEIHVPPHDLRTRITSFLWLRYSLKNSHKLFVISQNVFNLLYLHHKYCKNKITVIPNGYDASRLLQTGNNDHVSKIKKKFPRNRFIIGYFGELNEDKGVDLIIRIIINDKSRRFFFIVAGWGQLEGAIKKLAEKKPESILYAGRISKKDVYAYLKLCDLSLAFYRKSQLGTLFFGNPLKVYESLALGTNVLITNVTNLPKEVSDLCTLAKPNIGDLLDKMEQGCRKTHNHKWQENTRKTMSKYSWDKIATEIIIPELISAAASE